MDAPPRALCSRELAQFGAITLNFILMAGSHPDEGATRMTQDQTAAPDAAAEIERLCAGEDKRDALAQLSRLFWKSSDQRFLWGCARLLRHFEGDFTYHHD